MSNSSSLSDLCLSALRSGEVIAPDVEDLPKDMDAAEHIQDRMIAGMGVIGGWKLGATTADVKKHLGLPRQFFGAVPHTHVFRHSRVTGPWQENVGVESEYAFRFKSDLPPAGTPISRQTVADAIGTVHAAFEVPASRFGDIGKYGGFALVADNGAAGWLVIGEGRPYAELKDIVHAPVRLMVNGESLAEGSAAGIDGAPLGVIVNFVQAAHRRGYTIQTGQFVVIGSCTGYLRVPLDVPVQAEFTGLGRVEAVFTQEAD